MATASDEDMATSLLLTTDGEDAKPTSVVASVVRELKLQCKLAGPLILICLLIGSFQLLAIMFVGHLDDLSLASAAIAISIANVTGSSLLMGMAGALDTLCGQAYGAKQYRMLGLYLQRGLIVLNIACVPLSILWANIEYILIALGQTASIAKKAGQYTRWLIPTLFAYANSQPLLKFLQTQSLVLPILLAYIITVCCHIPLCWALVYKSGLEAMGAALATSISNWLVVALLALYVRFSPACDSTRTSFSWKAFQDLKGFFRLAIPSALMVCFEWWAYEVVTLLSGLLSDPALETSVLSVCFNTAMMAFMIPYGLGAAASTRVSNELGAGRPNAARTAMYVAVGLGCLDAVLLSSAFLIFRNVLGKAFSSDEDVIIYMAKIAPVLACSTTLDAISGVLSGIARGCGWQRAGTFINLGAYYAAGLPLAYVLGFVVHLKAEGLWMGTTGGSLVQLIGLATVTWITNWDKEATRAATRINSSLTSGQPLS